MHSLFLLQHDPENCLAMNLGSSLCCQIYQCSIWPLLPHTAWFFRSAEQCCWDLAWETMEMATFHDKKKAGPFTRGYKSVKALPKNIWAKIIFIAMKAKELGQDHPGKIIHSLKVGLALTLISLFYYFRLLYDGFGINTIWPVLTVMVVFKFSVGKKLR